MKEVPVRRREKVIESKREKMSGTESETLSDWAPPLAFKVFCKLVGPSCHCIGVLSDAVSSVSQTAIFKNPQRRALRARSGHAVAHSRLAHRVLKETSLTA